MHSSLEQERSKNSTLRSDLLKYQVSFDFGHVLLKFFHVGGLYHVEISLLICGSLHMGFIWSPSWVKCRFCNELWIAARKGTLESSSCIYRHYSVILASQQTSTCSKFMKTLERRSQNDQNLKFVWPFF